MDGIKVLIYDCGKVVEERYAKPDDRDKVFGRNGEVLYTPYRIAKELLCEVQDTDFIQVYNLPGFHQLKMIIDEDGRVKGLPANRYFCDGYGYIPIAGRIVIVPAYNDSYVSDYVFLDGDKDKEYIESMYKELKAINPGDGTDSEYRLSQEESDDTRNFFEYYTLTWC